MNIKNYRIKNKNKIKLFLIINITNNFTSPINLDTNIINLKDKHQIIQNNYCKITV